jgi:predicted phage terminase large subunit-like protein
MEATRKVADALFRMSFGAFFYRAFEFLNPGQRLVENWHVEALCYATEQMVIGESAKRLVINLPPQSLKSQIVSVALPAWMLGRNPAARIICVSYNEELAEKFSRDCRALMDSSFYKGVFPRTRLSPTKNSVTEFETTRRGYRFATSVGATLTGRSAGALIIDDPTKASDGESVHALTTADKWFHDSALSRLDSADAIVIVTAQRLNEKDLPGNLIAKGWPRLVIPAIATETRTYVIGRDETYTRPAGEVLQPKRDSLDHVLQKRQDFGSRVWAAQFQQDPTPAEGNHIKAHWLARYDFPPRERKFRRVVLSCDPAGKAGARNDYTAMIICAFDQKEIYILHVARGHWTVLQMRDRIKGLVREWNVDLVIVEDTSSGTGLVQLLKEEPHINVIGQQPKGDKEVRMSRHEARFESHGILLPREAPWLAGFETELLAFPSGRYADQVDALLLFLDWFPRAKRYEIPEGIGLPFVGIGSDSEQNPPSQHEDSGPILIWA